MGVRNWKNIFIIILERHILKTRILYKIYVHDGQGSQYIVVGGELEWSLGRDFDGDELRFIGVKSC